MFLAAIMLRYKAPNVTRAFRIPGGNSGLWFVCLLGLFGCIATIIIGFVPPTSIDVGSTPRYEGILGGGVAVFCVAPLLIYHIYRRYKR